MPSRGTYSYAKGAAVFLIVVLMQPVCEAKNNLKNIAETYKGDGVASYLAKPAFLASDGVRVDFETFSLSEGFNRELSISRLPPVKDNTYAVYFFSELDMEFEKDITDNISICMTLKNRDGVVLWSVDKHLSYWTKTTMLCNGMQRYVYRYRSDDYANNIGRLLPDEGMSYTLLIQCQVSESLAKTVGGKAHFFLRAGGYK